MNRSPSGRRTTSLADTPEKLDQEVARILAKRRSRVASQQSLRASTSPTRSTPLSLAQLNGNGKHAQTSPDIHKIGSYAKEDYGDADVEIYKDLLTVIKKEKVVYVTEGTQTDSNSPSKRGTENGVSSHYPPPTNINAPIIYPPPSPSYPSSNNTSYYNPSSNASFHNPSVNTSYASSSTNTSYNPSSTSYLNSSANTPFSRSTTSPWPVRREMFIEDDVDVPPPIYHREGPRYYPPPPQSKFGTVPIQPFTRVAPPNIASFFPVYSSRLPSQKSVVQQETPQTQPPQPQQAASVPLQSVASTPLVRAPSNSTGPLTRAPSNPAPMQTLPSQHTLQTVSSSAPVPPPAPPGIPVSPIPSASTNVLSPADATSYQDDSGLQDSEYYDDTMDDYYDGTGADDGTYAGEYDDEDDDDPERIILEMIE